MCCFEALVACSDVLIRVPCAFLRLWLLVYGVKGTWCSCSFNAMFGFETLVLLPECSGNHNSGSSLNSEHGGCYSGLVAYGHTM